MAKKQLEQITESGDFSFLGFTTRMLPTFSFIGATAGYAIARSMNFDSVFPNYVSESQMVMQNLNGATIGGLVGAGACLMTSALLAFATDKYANMLERRE